MFVHSPWGDRHVGYRVGLSWLPAPRPRLALTVGGVGRWSPLGGLLILLLLVHLPPFLCMGLDATSACTI